MTYLPTVALRNRAKVGNDHGKEALATTEHDLIAEIPMIVRVRPIVVELWTVLVALAVEDVRVTAGIGSVLCAI